jgi:hypothetical protein
VTGDGTTAGGGLIGGAIGGSATGSGTSGSGTSGSGTAGGTVGTGGATADGTSGTGTAGGTSGGTSGSGTAGGTTAGVTSPSTFSGGATGTYGGAGTTSDGINYDDTGYYGSSSGGYTSIGAGANVSGVVYGSGLVPECTYAPAPYCPVGSYIGDSAFGGNVGFSGFTGTSDGVPGTGSGGGTTGDGSGGAGAGGGTGTGTDGGTGTGTGTADGGTGTGADGGTSTGPGNGTGNGNGKGGSKDGTGGTGGSGGTGGGGSNGGGSTSGGGSNAGGNKGGPNGGGSSTGDGSGNGKKGPGFDCTSDGQKRVCHSPPVCVPGTHPAPCGACVPDGAPNNDCQAPATGGCWFTGGGFVSSAGGNGKDTFGGNAKGMKDGRVQGSWNSIHHGTGDHVHGRPVYLVCRTAAGPGPSQPGEKKGLTANQVYFGGPARWREAAAKSWSDNYWFDVVAEDHGEPGNVKTNGVTNKGTMPDWYHLTVRKQSDYVAGVSGAKVYEISGSLQGGNFQLHPANGGHPNSNTKLPTWVSIEH